MSTDSRAPRRQRGIRASRSALSRALVESELKTQTALAERIATLENLPSPPRDSVSRAFREMPVDPQTLSRIARALDVPEHTLYLTSEEVDAVQASAAPGSGSTELEAAETVDSTRGTTFPAVPAARAAMVRTVAVAAAVAATIVLMLLVWWSPGAVSTAKDPAAGAQSHPPPLVPRLGNFTLAIAALPGDEEGLIGSAIRAGVDSGVRVSSAAAEQLVDGLPPGRIAQQLRTDLVVHARRDLAGRYVTYAFDWLSERDQGALWIESFPLANEVAWHPRLGARVAAAIDLLIESAGTSVPIPDPDAHRAYLDGRTRLDDVGSELNIRRARDLFAGAVETDPGYGLPHAGLCEALILGSWWDNEQQALLEARKACEQAMALMPEHPYVNAVWANFLHRSGRDDAALDVLDAQLAFFPDNSDLLAMLGAVAFHRFRQAGDQAALNRAIDVLRRAIDVEPGHWKWQWLLATYLYFAGDLDGSITANRQAATLNENELVLANLGTALLCTGDFDGSLESFKRIAVIAPGGYIASEYIGMSYYYLGDYAQLIELRRSAIETIGRDGTPEVHEMWGNLGDSLRHHGDTFDALAAYERAAGIVERDYLAGNAGLSDRAHRAYYSLMIQRLGDQPASASVAQAIEADLEAAYSEDAETSALVRMAQVWKFQNRPERARAAFRLAKAKCAGMAQHPDLVELD